jgi:hypothetical protein
MRHRLIILGALAVTALAAAAVALAGNLTATATVSGAAGTSLALPGNPSVSDTLDGTDQTVSYLPLLSVVDARGSGGGWNLTVSATTFSDGSGHTLAPGTVSSVASACHAGSSCTAATNSVGFPLTVGGTAAKFFNAATNSGLGKIDVTPTVDVGIPGNAFAGTYTSTVTLAVTAGP